MIKIDAQGYEGQVLERVYETLRYAECILLSFPLKSFVRGIIFGLKLSIVLYRTVLPPGFESRS